jgi:hypothetical protein
VSIDVTGAYSGHMTAAKPPGNFRAVCTELRRPKTAWVAHVFGTFSGHTWLLVVQTVGYSTPARYNASLTLGRLALATSGVSATVTYVGQGSATIAADQRSAGISGTLKTAPGATALLLSGSLSCAQISLSH